MSDANAFRVVVVGAGPAGSRTAQCLFDAGLNPIVIDEAPRSGGQIYRRPPAFLSRPGSQLYGFEAGKAKRLHNAFDQLERHIDYRPDTIVWGYEDGQLLLAGPRGQERLAYDALVLATGTIDRIVPVEGWTQPGVYSLGGAQIMLKYQSCTIGRRPILVGTGPLLYLIAWQYAKAGAPAAAVIDTNGIRAKARALPYLLADPLTLAKGMWFALRLWLRRIPVIDNAQVQRIERTSEGFRIDYERKGTTASAEGDAVAIGYGLTPELQLASLLSCAMHFDAPSRQWLLDTDPDGRTSIARIYAAGDGVAIRGADAAEAAGELAAVAVLADMGRAVDARRQSRLRACLRRHGVFARGLQIAFPFPATMAARLADATVVCRCETVTAAQLREAIKSWDISDMGRLKAVTRCGMGRCQGRMCSPAAAEILADSARIPIERIGPIRSQPPIKPLPLPLRPLDVIR